MEKPFEKNATRDATSVWGVAKGRFLDLGREEHGAALVVTLAMFFLMYLTCCGIFSISTAVKERIHLQNAADAAAYSAAVVQADTISRIATINRAMSWTYVDMTRRQMDYIVRRWLWHTVHHYQQDREGARLYNRGGFCSPCGYHASPCVGWFIGSNVKSAASVFKVNLNGILGVASYLGLDLQTDDMTALFGSMGQGVTVNIDTLQADLLAHDAYDTVKNLEKLLGKNPFDPKNDVFKGMMRVKDDIASSTSCLSNIRTANSILAMWKNQNPAKRDCCDTVDEGCELNPGCVACVAEKWIPLQLKAKIFIDRLNIARMNIVERDLALAMPKHIAETVRENLKANIPADMWPQCQYLLDQNENVLDGDGEDGLTYTGYFTNLRNNAVDEAKFLSFADFVNYDDIRDLTEDAVSGAITKVFNKLGGGVFELDPLKVTSRYSCGVDQWFVRGNGQGRTDNYIGLQRSYKHWAEDPLSSIHAAHSPLPPTCWNLKKLHGAPATVALYSEWAWWSDVWCCPRILFKRYHLHPMPHMSKFWPMKMECDHNDKPGLFGTEELAGTIKSIKEYEDILKGIEDVAKGSIKGRSDDGGDGNGSSTQPDTGTESGYQTVYGDGEITVGDDGSVSTGDVSSDSSVDLTKLEMGDVDYGSPGKESDLSSFSSSGIEKYEDGCLMTYPLLNGTSHMVGYARHYADMPQIYDSAYVGECAKPLILSVRYFGPAGTLSVGIRRTNQNVFTRILESITGIFRAFSPDWNGLVGMTHTYVFASAKAGYKDKGESLDALDYKVDWQPNNQSWNLCQSDWDAVFVPVRKAKSLALGMRIGSDDSSVTLGSWTQQSQEEMVLDHWVSDEDKWTAFDGTKGDVNGWSSISAPKGVLRGSVNGEVHNGTLNWGNLSRVMYH